MSDTENTLAQLHAQLDRLDHQQRQLQDELIAVRKALLDLGADQNRAETNEPEIAQAVETPAHVPLPVDTSTETTSAAPLPNDSRKWALEDFIGENLLNKIGIAILVIGVGIGAKYAIDHNLISPLMRIVLGYLSGTTLLLFAIKLKAKYHSFSAVLLSGGMAVLYFITFAAYDVYELLPRMLAFGLMFLFTLFTVFASLRYNAQVIAIIGLVGAYAVPFLLSDNSGRAAILFSYITIINAGILVISFRKTWSALFYTAFLFTWLIYSAWVVGSLELDTDLWTALAFSTIFFAIFYSAIIAYRINSQQSLSRWDITVLLFNALIYFGFGYFAIDGRTNGEAYLGAFALFNALLHFITSVIVFRSKSASRDIFFFTAGLVLSFLTLAIPIQLDGKWVTILWGAEAVLLFWIGRTKVFPVYEKLSYTLIILTFISLTDDWADYYREADFVGQGFKPFAHLTFFSSVWVMACLSLITYFHVRYQNTSNTLLVKAFTWVVPALLLLTIYSGFYKEVEAIWDSRYVNFPTGSDETTDYLNIVRNDMIDFRNISLFIYTALFVIAGSYFNQKKVRNHYLTYTLAVGAALSMIYMATQGLDSLAALRQTFLTYRDVDVNAPGLANVLIRYLVYLVVIPLAWVIRHAVKENEEDFLSYWEVFVHLFLLLLLSSELVNILALARYDDNNQLSISILWGVYALGLIVYGLRRGKRYLRVLAIAIFGVTILKLLFHDLASLPTISKTIVMIILGTILLVASFLYNKFKRA